MKMISKTFGIVFIKRIYHGQTHLTAGILYFDHRLLVVFPASQPNGSVRCELNAVLRNIDEYLDEPVVIGIDHHMILHIEDQLMLITEETKRLIRLVNENLDYEKIRSNQITLQKLHYPLIEVFEIIKEQLALQAEEKQNQVVN